MTHVSISRSYAVLVGLEAYVKTRRRGKKIMKKIVHHRDKLLEPEEERKRLEAERDKSESAEIERRYLEQKEKRERAEWEKNRADRRLLEKLENFRSRPRSGNSHTEGDLTPKKETFPTSPLGHEAASAKFTSNKENTVMSSPTAITPSRMEPHVTSPKEKRPDPDIEAPGTGPENAIAPEGTRDS
jgi:hypothetical protein